MEQELAHFLVLGFNGFLLIFFCFSAALLLLGFVASR
jgi:hypothetical protein